MGGRDKDMSGDKYDDKFLAVINPTANNGRAGKNWPEISNRLEKRGLKFKEEFTRYPGHADEITRYHLENGCRTVMAVGGDGTFSEVAAGFFGDDGHINPEAAMRIYPLGSGCDLALYYDLKPGKKLADQLSRQGKERYLDVIEVKGSGFSKVPVRKEKWMAVNIVDIGAIAESLRKVHEKGKKKHTFRYVSSALFTALKYSTIPLEVKVDNNKVFSGSALDVFVANGPTMAGGFPLAPPAEPEDGLLDVIILPELSRARLIRDFFKAYRGRHLRLPEIKYHQGERVDVALYEGGPLEIDGDYVAELSEGKIRFEIKPGAIKLRI